MILEIFLFVLIILWLFASITFWMIFRKWLRSSPPARQTVSTGKLNSNPSDKLWLYLETTFLGVRLLTYFYLSYCLPTENVKLAFSVAKATLQLQLQSVYLSVHHKTTSASQNQANLSLYLSTNLSDTYQPSCQSATMPPPLCQSAIIALIHHGNQPSWQSAIAPISHNQSVCILY